MKKKVIVLGSNGMAGHVMTVGLKSEPSKYEVIDVARSTSAIKPAVILDVTNFEALGTLIETTNADFIINCVGLLNQTAEDYPDQAILINSYLPHFLEMKTKNMSTKVIHISTDCVFSGEKGDYIEEDLKDGIGFYAQSKALGEIINNKDLTIRTSIIGPELKNNGIGLFNWYSQQKGEIFGYKKAFGTGVTVIELMKAVKQVLEQDLVGLVHLVNGAKIAKYDLLLLFNKIFEITDISVNVNDTFESDKSVVSTRNDLVHNVPSYSTMIEEMKAWMERNSSIYPHYSRFIKK